MREVATFVSERLAPMEAVLSTATHFVLKKYNEFSLSYKIVGTLPIFITLLILTCSVEHSYQINSVYYIVPIILLMLINFFNSMKEVEINILLKIGEMVNHLGEKLVEFNDPNHECLGCAMCATRCPDMAIKEVYRG